MLNCLPDASIHDQTQIWASDVTPAPAVVAGRRIGAGLWIEAGGCHARRLLLENDERTFACEACGLMVDRDLNAARNLAKLVQSVAQSGWETQTARGADRKPQPAGQVAMKREAGTGSCLGEPGTVQP